MIEHHTLETWEEEKKEDFSKETSVKRHGHEQILKINHYDSDVS